MTSKYSEDQRGLTTRETEPRQPLSRRQALRYAGSAVAILPLAKLLGCADTGSTAAGDVVTGGTAAGGGGTLATGGETATGGSTDAATGGATDTATGGSTGSTGSTGSWATGGTAAMTALASYPNPFSTGPDACTPTCQMTLGPCHDDLAPEREDVSEGKEGLPMRFALRILDADCNPVTDANVDIWHCDALGIYSSETADNPGFCTGTDAVALAARFFRGHQMTDDNGIAWFNSCFPGWYPSRAIHVHFTVRRSSRDGDEYLTSQVAFPEDLVADVCTTHTDYASNGLPDTANTTDTVFPSDSVDAYVVDTMQMSDGALLAYKTIIIRSALTDDVCSAGGSGGPTMGGPPGRG